MEERKRRLSTITQISPDTLKAIDRPRRLSVIEDGDETEVPNGTYKKHSGTGRKLTATFGNLALFKDEDEEEGGQATFMSAYTTPGPRERATSEKKKANLGVMLGVYLPTIQHILGVTMFIRLFWVVGISGVPHTMILLLLCCLCTLLTSISLSAVATNGVVESGGAYFMISRNLGAEFGSAVGILFYLANTVATSMYLVGGVEVMLLYIFPSMTIGGEEVHSDTSMWGMMSHNYRIYGTAFLLLEVVIVAMGVRFVQILAPISLACVILSILACFAGGVEKAITHSGQHVCMLNNQLLPSRIFFPHDANLDDLCKYCVKSEDLSEDFCENSTSSTFCSHFAAGSLQCVNAFPGITPEVLSANMAPMYMSKGQSYPNVEADFGLEVFQDVDTTFFILLAIYFPAVTGIMTGTNMSGDLKDPQKSIPCGTIAATLTTSVIYYALAILFGASITGPVLRDKYGKSIDSTLVVASLAWPSPWVVVIGSFLSTFGAALQCLCSAPRLLQSIAKDDVIPALAPFARVTSTNEPFLGLLFTAVIAECAILLGAVDAIAEVLDFFFLMCYAFVNLICALHSLMKAPNWRPRFRYYHWSLSLIGAFLCFFIMFASHWIYAMIAIALTLAIYKYVEWKGAKKEWGDGIRGLALTTAQYSLLKVEDKDPHPKNWRPQLLIIIDGNWSREIIDMRCISMLNLAGQLKAGRGLAIVVGLVKGDSVSSKDRKNAENIKKRLQHDMTSARLRGFPKTLIFYETQIEGCISALYQSVGIGGLRPNTVLLNFPRVGDDEDPLEHELFAEKLLKGASQDNCLLVAKGIIDFPQPHQRLIGTIDIWWIVQDGGILMLIAFLLKQHKVWKGCQLRIYAVAQHVDGGDYLKAELQKYIYMLRIDATVFIVDMIDPDVSEDAVQRTLRMEQKTKNKLFGMSKSNSATFTNGAFSNDDTVNSRSGLQSNDSTCDRVSDDITVETSFIQDAYEKFETESMAPDEPSVEGVDKKKIKKMNAAMRLNQVIHEYSTESQLILLSLPKPPKTRRLLVDNYIAYVDALTENFHRVLLIGGSGKEVITIDS
ncbi:hypothetical protein L596_003163 [Steinernema carpocapsae]|uniref:Amino acid permease/ SLC12A domain-containing protein n=3 Tax=Steinernema carpocapsae TaxID=34508 RepID=A0A4U8URM0_STECR|nr:hypothetical protein L596_003163 [Steinernema carpocapsae]